MKVSVIVPAFNEDRFLAETIRRLHAALDTRCEYDVIVVDHGSTDGSAAVAHQHGANVLRHESGTVGSARNAGVRASTGECLVFIDADVWVTREWGERLPAALELLRREPRVVTGSLCGISAEPSWIERHWFQPRLQRATHVGSGHMIVTRRFFDELGGFDELLETGEDYDFCARARLAGGSIVLDPQLVVTHEGYPRTLAAFIRREAWHGAGDFTSLPAVLRSKVALATILFVALHLLALISLPAGVAPLGLAAGAGIAGLCMASSIGKYGLQSVQSFVVTSALFYLYYAGRALALVRALVRRGGASRRVPGRSPRVPAGTA